MSLRSRTQMNIFLVQFELSAFLFCFSKHIVYQSRFFVTTHHMYYCLFWYFF